MNVHEYQAKELLARYGVPVPDGIVCDTAEEAAAAFDKLGADLAVVKAQIHAGGRGKAGGVKLVKSAAEAQEKAAGMLGKAMVTHQTGPEGRVVRKVYVTRGSDIATELYLAVVVDRAYGAPVMMACPEGGVEIEELAGTKPEAIAKERIHPMQGMLPFQARRACSVRWPR